MPKLNERKSAVPAIPTFLQLPAETRTQLESAIGRPGIDSLRDAVIAAARLLDRETRRREKVARRREARRRQISSP